MEAEFWHDRWAEGRTAWNQADVHPLLVEHWSAAIDGRSGAVFVPLCGTSVDMDWLAAQGHRVVGCELSPLAVRAFFADRGLEPVERSEGDLTVFTAGPFELWCGDFFAVPASALRDVAVVYDRASIVALPTDMRSRYAEHLTAIAPDDVTILLISFEYDVSEMDGPPFSVTREEVAGLYGEAFAIDVVAVEDVTTRNADLAARGLSHVTETVTVLQRRA